MGDGVSLAYERPHEGRAQGRGHAYDEGFMMERLLAGEYMLEGYLRSKRTERTTGRTALLPN